MTRYGVAFTTSASTVVYVEADNPEQARERANEKFEAPMICAQCSGWGSEDDEDATNSGVELSDSWEADESTEGVWEAGAS